MNKISKLFKPTGSILLINKLPQEICGSNARKMGAKLANYRKIIGKLSETGRNKPLKWKERKGIISITVSVFLYDIMILHEFDIIPSHSFLHIQFFHD